MFEDRSRLHEHGYQHRVVKTIDRMLIDILISADNYINICFDRKGLHSLRSKIVNDFCAVPYIGYSPALPAFRP